MNRRNFFKAVTGFVAGIFATSVEGKKFNTEDFGGWNPKDGWSAGIDPESEWVKHGQRALDFQKALNEVVKEKLVCNGQNGTLCPRCKFNCPDMTIGTSSNNVQWVIKMDYWDKDEPDIYTWTDGTPI